MMICGCGTSPYLFLENSNNQPDCIDRLIPKFKTELYNAQINVTGKHLSGLLLFKTMPDSSVRTVFTSETGVTFFDFEFAKNGFRVIYCIKKLDRKSVINRLRSDIGLLIRYNMQGAPSITKSGNHELYFGYPGKKETTWYITGSDCSAINRIETSSDKKRKVVVNLFGYGTSMPDSVYLNHQLFEYNISLKKITR